MKTTVRVPALCFVLALTAAIALRSAQAVLLYDNGAPDQQNGNEMTQWIQAEDFTLGGAAVLGSVQFWDLEQSGAFQGSIIWQIYSNSGSNQPGALLFSGTALNLTHTATGLNGPGGLMEFVDTFDVGAVSLTAGTFWLGLHNGPLTTTNRVEFYWETTALNGRAGGQEDIAPFGDGFTANGQEKAFLLNGTVGGSVPDTGTSGLLLGLGLLGVFFTQRALGWRTVADQAV
jgi:hypothetical protein